MAPDGKILALGAKDGTIRFLDPASGQELRQVGTHAGGMMHLAFSPNGKVLASAGHDKAIRLWDPAAGKPVGTLEGHQGDVWRLAFSPDGKLLASASHDRTVRLWDVVAGQEVRTLTGSQGEVESVAFSPDGKLLASGARERTARLWDVATGKELHQFQGHTGWVYVVAFSPDGKTLATGSLDNTVCLWEVATRKERARLVGHRGGVISVTFSPDVRKLATGSADSTALVWDLTGQRRGGELPVVNLTAAEWESSWTDLTSADAALAYRALWRLVTTRQTPAQLGARLKPVGKVDRQRVQRLVAELDDDTFAVRENATTELEKLGPAVEPLLRKALDDAISAEVRQRLTMLLNKMAVGSSGEYWRLLRALEVLERIGTAEARQVLQTLAQGEPDAPVTREAKASLERLK
jgi:hypothetical protein